MLRLYIYIYIYIYACTDLYHICNCPAQVDINIQRRNIPKIAKRKTEIELLKENISLLPYIDPL